MYTQSYKNQAARNLEINEGEVTMYSRRHNLSCLYLSHICVFMAFFCLPFITVMQQRVSHTSRKIIEG